MSGIMQEQCSSLSILMFYVLLESTLFEENLYLTKMHLGAAIFSIQKNYVLNVNVILVNSMQIILI